tara:strand:+ start:3912 stop:4055 length:144 start_codon:yes stop_codon:yes gene_type:complete
LGNRPRCRIEWLEMAVVGDALNWMGFQGNGNIKEDGIEDPETTAHGI